MLEPGSRTLLLDSLRPPPGYELDLAVGTSYTLDLHALLMTPLAFAMFAWEQDEDDRNPNVIASLEAVRRYADRIHVFTQAGGISLPPEYRTLVAYLEESIHEVTAPQGGIFHPKVWVLRFRQPNASAVSYRLLCLSRNLTFDRSWDTVLSLEGEPTEAASNTGPLADFVAALPTLALSPLGAQTIEEITNLATELRDVSFTAPENFEDVRFLPIGVAGHNDFPVMNGPHDRLVCISPFLTQGAVTRLSSVAEEAILVSRPESLARLGAASLTGFDPLFVLNDDAQPVSEEEDAADVTEIRGEATSERTGEDPSIELMGLHAKVYVSDREDCSTVWVGSANATDAALHTNVEFMVELTGPPDVCGTRALLDTEPKEPTFGTLLVPYLPEEDPRDPTEVEQAFEELDKVARLLAQVGWILHVDEQVDETFVLKGCPKQPVEEALIANCGVRCWPISLRREVEGRHVVAGNEPMNFGSVPFDRITPFLAFELTLPGFTRWPKRFVVRAELVGAPSDRRGRLVGSLLKNAADFLLYLGFLLSDSAEGQLSMDQPSAGDGQGWSGMFGAGVDSVLEPMLKALSTDPGRLDHIAALIEDLRSTAEGSSRIPPQFAEVWDPIWSVRQEATR